MFLFSDMIVYLVTNEMHDLHLFIQSTGGFHGWLKAA